MYYLSIPIDQNTLELILFNNQTDTWPSGIIRVGDYFIAKDEDEANCYHLYPAFSLDISKENYAKGATAYTMPQPDNDNHIPILNNVTFECLIGFFIGINIKA